MHIIYDATMFGMQRYGGVSRYFNEIIRRIITDPQCQVSLFMGLYINRYGLQRCRSQFKHFWGVRRPFIPKTHAAAQWLNAKMFSHFAARVPFDVYHTTWFFEPNLNTHRPRIITVHDLILYHGQSPVPRAGRDHMARAIEGADGVICVSHSTKREVLASLQVPESRIAVIHHGAPPAVEPTPGRAVHEPYLLYVGFRGGYKNTDTLLRAYAGNSQVQRNFRLVLFGGGALRAAELELVRDLGIDNRLTVIPRGDDADLANLYTHAQALVYPSLHEGFGIPLLEAFTYRCPVISSNATSLPEVAGDAAHYFDPQNVDEMSQALTRIVEDASLRRRLIDSGTERLKQFSWDRSAAEHVAFYEKVLSASPAGCRL